MKKKGASQDDSGLQLANTHFVEPEGIDLPAVEDEIPEGSPLYLAADLQNAFYTGHA